MPIALRALPVLLALVASPVLAQSNEDLSLNLTQNPFFQVGESNYVSIDGCESQLASELTVVGTYALEASDSATYELRLSLAEGSAPCSWNTFGATCEGNVSESEGSVCYCLKQVSTGSVSSSFSLGGLIDSDCDALSAQAVSGTLRFFLQYRATSPEEVNLEGTSLDVTLDFSPPAQPVAAPTVVPVEAGLTVTFPTSDGVDVKGYEVCYKVEGAPGAAAGSKGSVASREGYTCTSATAGTSKRISDLENGVVYSVVYATVDVAGNRSSNSPAATGTPEESFDFAEWYHSRNGPAEGGCDIRPGGSPSSAWWLLGVLAWVRRRKSGPGALAAALLLMPGVSLAGDGQTARTAAVELRAGAFLPDVDKTFPTAACKASGQCPYEAVFRNDDPLMLMLLVDKHLLLDYGTLSFGGGLGYWSVEGKALLGAGVRASDTTELSVVPMLLQFTYRLDMFQDVIPIVPVLRVGADYYYWRILDGEGEVASFEPGDKAEGGTLGWHYTLGAHILLDFFAGGMASDFDRDAGVNNSYVTVEYQKSDITDFGSDKALRLGSEVLFFGLALDL